VDLLTLHVDGHAGSSKKDEHTNGGGSGGGGPSDPLIQAVIQKLPEKGPWPKAEREIWIKMLEMAFDFYYGPTDE
jgi:hypothetical protein